jgi:hypothetical protein
MNPLSLLRDAQSNAEGLTRFGKMLVRRIDVNHVRPVEAADNAEIFRETGRTPVVWLGGILTDASHHKADQLFWQGKGVPFYIADNGHGLNRAADNAQILKQTIQAALKETGAKQVYVGTQSKGCTDAMKMLLDHPDVKPLVRGVYFHNGPFKGGFTSDPAKGQALRGLVELIVPNKYHDNLEAARELVAGSGHIMDLRERWASFVEGMPDNMFITNFTSVLKGTKTGGRSGHDLIIPRDSQALPHYDRSLPQAARIEEPEFEHNHITIHQFKPVIEHMDSTMRERDQLVRAMEQSAV